MKVCVLVERLSLRLPVGHIQVTKGKNVSFTLVHRSLLLFFERRRAPRLEFAHAARGPTMSCSLINEARRNTRLRN